MGSTIRAGKFLRNPRGTVLCTGATALTVWGAVASLLHPLESRAQDASAADTDALAEVVVTARKRDESVQSVPISIAVLNGAELLDSGVLRTSELQYAVPGFYVQNYETRATITMRGVGTQLAGGASSVATHVNGVYLASAAAQLNRLFDIERIEVLKGPQGTLYGRNATGGALNVISRRPGNEFAADVSLGYGTYSTMSFDGGVTVPFGDDWSMRLAASATDGDGQFTNVINNRKIGNEDFQGGRFSLAGKLGSVEADFFAQYSRDKDDTQLTLIPLVSATNPAPLLGWNRTAFDGPTEPFIERKSFVSGLTLSGDFGNGYSWRSITGYLDYKEGDDTLADVNPRPNLAARLSISFPQLAEQFSQEFQLLYTGDRLNWVVGAYYLDDDQGNKRRASFAPSGLVLLDSVGSDKTQVTAAFGDLNYNLTERLRLNAGLRVNREKVRNSFEGVGAFDGDPFDISGNQGDPTGRIGLDFTVRPGLMFYGSVSSGYQAGFFNNTFDAVTGNSIANEVDPEEIIAVEAGFKSILPGERGFLNAAAFYYDYKDMQVQIGGIFLLPNGQPDPAQPPFFYADNAAKAEIYGIDLELTELRLAEHFKMNVSASYLSAKYKDYASILSNRQPVNFKGNTLPRSPEFSAASSFVIDNLRFGEKAEGSLRFEYNYRDKTYFTRENTVAASQDSYGLVNVIATMEFDDGRWGLTAAGRNLTDEEFFDFKDGNNFANTGEFRSWEFSVRYRFQ
jgi:iron complex outermembrane receptor protein